MKAIKTIFIVDDNAMYLKTLAESMYDKVDFPYRLYAFASGKELLGNMNLSPDIIVLDFFLSDTTGNMLLQEIKKMNPKVIIIIVSMENDIKIVGKALNLGVFDYLHKGDDGFSGVVDAVNRANEIMVGDRHVVINRRNILYIVGAILIIGLLVVLLIN